MKSGIARLLALILLMQLLVPAASASQMTEDGHVIAHPELLEEYVFPDDWSADALRFCVGNGMMKGRANGLVPMDHTTRAETAALLVRMLGVKPSEGNLDRFADADPQAWYYPELTAAVEQGILNGTSQTTLAPNAPVTRQQAFVMIARAFGLYAADPFAWKNFSDGEDCADYARDAVCALTERGVVAGYPDGTIRPDRYITRAELAKLLYGLFTCICDTPESLPASGSVLYRGSQPIPAGYRLEGSLTITGELTLTGISVRDTLTLRPASGTAAVENCEAAMVVCATPGMTLNLTGTLERCVLQRDQITLTGTGSVSELILCAGDAVVEVPHTHLKDRTKPDPADALKIVDTLTVWDTVTEDTVLYSGQNLTGWIRSLPAGTKLRHYYYREGNAAAAVYTEDGRFGWVNIRHIAIPTEQLKLDKPYPREIMEAFVNQKGYDSSTGYMIWVSLKTQTVNVFEGAQGSWKLIRSMPCASGKNSTPTARGEFAIKNKLWEWDFGTYKVRYVTVFYGGYAFHSRIYDRSYSTMLDDALGYPASDGCLRMRDEDCRYIMEQMPYGTRVVVY